MNNKIDIVQAIEDPQLFGSLFGDQATWGNWKVFLSALFGLGLPKGKKALSLYRECTGRQRPPKKQFNEAFAIVGRRGGKSFISSVIACHLALFHDWQPYLAKGEVGWIMVIASDRKQARVILGYIKGILALPIFKGMVEKELSWEVQLKNRITISIQTCDYRSIRGYTCVAAICDEIAFWQSEGANPAKEILTALRPSMATIPGSLLLGLSTPYARSGILYESYRKHFGQDNSDVLIWKAPTVVMNPTISKKIIERAMEDDYSAGRAEWEADFREDLETFLPSNIIEDAVIPGRFMLPYVGYSYKAFTDPSGGRNDSFTLAIAHKEDNTGRYVLDVLEERRPPFGPQDVVNEYADILKKYQINHVRGDRYAGEWVSRAFQDAGISYEASERNKSEIYLEFAPLMMQGQVDLLDNKRLFNQLRSLDRRTRSGGRDLVDHPPGGHDDLANAAAGAIVEITGGDECGFGALADGDSDDEDGESTGSWGVNRAIGNLEKSVNDD